MINKQYVPMAPLNALQVLRSLGYNIDAEDSQWDALLGMLVALAKEIEVLRDIIGTQCINENE